MIQYISISYFRILTFIKKKRLNFLPAHSWVWYPHW